ncbi:MAG: 50S ribosomal protein L10 [Phycisphaerales bacterium]|nr:50S ribosomal protein L10 [Phycisphaerales bacterium]
MSKPIKTMIAAEYRKRFGDLTEALLVDVRGIEANDNNELRQALHAQGVRITVIRNTLARTAFADTPLEAMSTALDGPSALCYGGESVVDVARLMIDWAKKIDQLELKAAVLDGEFFEGAKGVKQLSDFPTKEESKARVVQLVLAPAGNVVGGATGPGGKLLGVIKEIQERLEKGETIEKIA